MENSSKSQKVASPPQAHVCTRSLRRTLTHQRCRRWNPENDTLWWRRARALEPTGLSQTQPPPADECDLGQMRSLLEPCLIPASTPASLWGLSSRPPGPALHPGLRRAPPSIAERVRGGGEANAEAAPWLCVRSPAGVPARLGRDRSRRCRRGPGASRPHGGDPCGSQLPLHGGSKSSAAQRARGPAWPSVSVSVYGGGAQLARGGDPRQSVGDPRAHLCCPHGCRESASRRQRRVSAPVSAGALPTCRFDWPSLGTVSIQL